ncbi:hypothetical protein T492DRAFT_999351 [Pavlovales sp. CCMP2436]|nr:hypothetical protein T492DRAFT_999351 [Pavlovales sp. CCMP2436]
MESFLNDSTVSNPTLSAKMSDKKAEQDIDLLRNRLRMLRAEEGKAKAKVVETKKRQDEILALRTRNEELAQRRVEHRFGEEEKTRKLREERLSKKNDSRLAVKERFDQMYAKRREEAVQLKKEEAQNGRMVRSLRDEEIAKAQRRREQILTQQRRAQSELGNKRQEQQQGLISNFLGLIAEEEGRRQEVEKEIAEMEKDELEQIEKLRTLQEEQRLSYDELEFALTQ